MLLPILTSKISPDFRDFNFHNQKFPGFWNLDSLALGESVTRFVPFFTKKIKDFSRTFKDTFPIFRGLHSVQRRALSLCLLQFFQNMSNFILKVFLCLLGWITLAPKFKDFPPSTDCNFQGLSRPWIFIRELKQRRFWAVHVYRKWSILHASLKHFVA